MIVSPELALSNIEHMLRSAANSLHQSPDRSDMHQMLFTVMAEILPLSQLQGNITMVINCLRKGLECDQIQVQQSCLNIINALVQTDFKIHDIPHLLQSK